MQVKSAAMTSDIENNHLAVTGTKAAINTNCFAVLLKILKVLDELDQSQFNCPFLQDFIVLFGIHYNFLCRFLEFCRRLLLYLI